MIKIEQNQVWIGISLLQKNNLKIILLWQILSFVIADDQYYIERSTWAWYDNFDDTKSSNIVKPFRMPKNVMLLQGKESMAVNSRAMSNFFLRKENRKQRNGLQPFRKRYLNTKI